MIEIKDPIRPWWPGDSRVEKFMPRIANAIDRHRDKLPEAARIDIYNRAYEAVWEAIQEFEKKSKISNVVAK